VQKSCIISQPPSQLITNAARFDVQLPCQGKVKTDVFMDLQVDCVRGSVQHTSWTSAFRWPTSQASQTSARLNVDWRHGCATDQNSARSAELPRCSTSRLECPPCLPPLNIHQSRTIQSWVENPSLQPSLQHSLKTFCFKSVLYSLTYLLTY